MSYNIFRFWQKPEIWHRFRPLLMDSEINYILSCQDINGGFSNWQNSMTYLETCYYSIVCLGLCNCENLCRSNVTDYILSHSCIDGGYTDCPNGDRSNIFNTFYAIVCLSMLDKVVHIKRERTIKFLLLKKRGGGGFSEYHDDPSSMIHTFWSVISLDLLNAAHILNRESIREFILACRTKTGLFGNYGNSTYGYIEYTAYAIIINSVLDLGMKFIKSEIISEIDKRKLKDGYSSYYYEDFNYFDTFWALYLCHYFQYESKIDQKLKLPPKSVWQIFLNSVTRLMFHKKRVIPNRFTTYEISVPKVKMDGISYYLRENRFKSLKDIEYIGFELYKSLPLDIKKNLKKNSSNGVLFDINNNLLELPWEILLCGNKMLQLLRPIARLNNCSIEAYYMNFKKCLIVYDTNLPSSIYEHKEIKNLLRKNNVHTKALTFSNFTLDDINNSYQIIHLTGHSANGMLLINKKLVETSSIITHLIKLEFKGLFICNLCNDQLQFLLKCKNAMFTILNYFGLLEGRIGYEFIKEVYKYLFTQNNIGEAVRIAKTKSFYFTNHKIGLPYYQLWGNPNLYL